MFRPYICCVIFIGMTHLPMFDKDCRLFAALTSFILTLLLGWDALINSDGILYVTQAHLIHDGAWRDALAHYPWPGYAALMAAVAWFGPSIEHSAVIINGICYALMVAGFVTVIKQAGGNHAIQWLAAVALLAHPAINGYREYIIRDVGLWGMLFWGVYAVSRFHEHRQWRDVLLWTASMTIAVLFRIEAMVFLLLAPLGLLLVTPRRSFIDVLRFQSLFILAGLIGLAVMMLSGNTFELGRLGDLADYFAGLSKVYSSFTDRAQGLAKVFSHEMKIKHATIALSGAIVTYLVYLAIKVFTPVYLFLAGITGVKKLTPRSITLSYVWVFIAIAILIIITFFSQLYFMSSRYMIPLVLLLITFVPQGIHHIAISRGNGTWLGNRFMFPVMTLVLTAMFISGVTSFGHSKEYLRESGEWIHTHVKPDARIFIGEKHVAYYAQRFDTLELLDYRAEKSLKKAMKNTFEGNDIVVLYHDKDTKDLDAYVRKHFANSKKMNFENKRHDGVTIIILNEQALLPSSPVAHTPSAP